MRKALLFSLLVFCLLGTLAAILLVPTALAGRQAAPQVFSSPINVSCVRVSAYECRLQVDAFTIRVDPLNRLQAFQLRANNSLLYDFRTDVSNPPAGDYSPSSVALDFAATCGAAYTVNLLARDSADANFLNAGQAEEVVCPQAEPTPTPTLGPTPTATPPGGGSAQRVFLPLSIRTAP